MQCKECLKFKLEIDFYASNKARCKECIKTAVKPWPVCAVPECICKPEAHHPDYSRPLDVVWLFDLHHKAAHNITREATRSAKQGAFSLEPF